jgi:hypothetical protein
MSTLVQPTQAPAGQPRPGGADIYYFANSARDAIPIMRQGGYLGFISTPKQGNKIPPGSWWIADNGMGPGRSGVIKGGHGKGAVTGDQLLRWLDNYAPEERDRCLFAVAPDVVGDAAATLRRSRPYLARIRELGYPVAYVLQDCQEDVPVPWDEIDAVFVGGSDAFKLGPVAAALCREARARGLWVHVGRVNSGKRLIYAVSIGAGSADGTYLVFGARRGLPNVNLPRLLGWLAEANTQPQLQLAA